MDKMQNRLKIGLFMNYLVHGFALIILTQNLLALSANWHSSLATASFVLSGIGIGRLIAYLIMGMISDKFGRKTTLLIGMLSYLIFFIATPFNHQIGLAYLLSIVAGISNSALDSATYPLFTEFNAKSSSNNILLKAFISIGEFILPLMVIFLKDNQMWFGFSFMLPAIILGLNILNLMTVKFPKANKQQNTNETSKLKLSGIGKVMATGALLTYGYTSMAVMIWFTQWITIFANSVGFNDWTAHFLLSLYSIGSITGVISSFIIMKKFNVRNHWFLGMNMLATLAIATIAFSHISTVSLIAVFLFGFSASGGAMQIALTILLSIFPKHKGLFTGVYFIFGSLASFTVPIISGFLTKFGSAHILNADILVAIVGLISAIIIFETVPQTTSLDQPRQQINQIDAQIAKLLEKRFQVVEEVYQIKQTQQLATKDENREHLVLQRIKDLTRSPHLKQYNQNIFQNIMDNSKQYQELLKTNGKE
ncbi:MFS transporter [Apilactobacillus xinyiensis]|uniref:MFS transporter n=1 Tax=Apilactobacillus xinyiensis TaxID=2841032 RepID=UPI001C7CE4E6|nr:MFS transporter [Apilactobacillus xinyiensis]